MNNFSPQPRTKGKRLLFLTNNLAVSHPLLSFLSETEFISFCTKKLNMELIDYYKPEIVISYNYHYIIKPEILKALNGKVINLHTSFLPWNRGANPNFWSFIENTPKGVTIHTMSEKIDEGDILIQKEVLFDMKTATFRTTYLKLHEVMIELFIRNWSRLREGTIPSLPQLSIDGTYHCKKDFERINQVLTVDWDMNVGDYLRLYNMKKEG